MAKKFGKFLLFATAVSAACGGLYYYMKKESENTVSDDSAEDDVEEIPADSADGERSYVPLHFDKDESSSSVEEFFDDDDDGSLDAI
ncbi:MAG: hypothetical protein ACI4SZ_03050 [Lachnospiraceae bacterium]